MDIFNNKELLKKIVKESKTKKEILNKLGYITLAGNYRTLDRYVKKHSISTSHLENISGFSKGHKYNKKWEDKDVFIKNSKAKINNKELKNRLYKSNIKKEKCELCGQDENWNGNKLTLILDHIDGDNKNNEISNLRIICPNCDSTLPTYMGRNNKTHKTRLREKQRKQDQKQLLKKHFKEKLIQERKNLILNSSIDFSKKTWGVEVAKVLDKSPQYSLKWVKKHMKECL